MARSAADALSEIPLFAQLSGRQLRNLAKTATEEVYERGTTIVREGGRTPTLFVVLEGHAKVVRDGRTVSRRKAGEFFGEISMIDGRPRSASVVADTDLRCLVLGQRELKEIVANDPKVAWALLESLATRLRGE